MLGIFFIIFGLLPIFLKINTFKNFFSGIPSLCQTVWIQIRPDKMSGLIWVQTDCISYQQTTLTSNFSEVTGFKRIKFAFLSTIFSITLIDAHVKAWKLMLAWKHGYWSSCKSIEIHFCEKKKKWYLWKSMEINTHEMHGNWVFM